MANKFWVGNGGNWNSSSHWSLTSGGVGGAGAPSLSDDAIFDANSFSSAGQIVNVTSFNVDTCKSLTMTAVTNAPTLQWTVTGAGNETTLTVGNGNINIPASVIFAISGAAGNAELRPLGNGTITILAAIPYFTGGRSFALLAPAGGQTLNLGAVLTCQIIQIASGGIFNTNNFNITTERLEIDTAGTGTTFNAGSSSITFVNSGLTANQVGFFMVGANATFNKGTSTLIFDSSCTDASLDPSNGGFTTNHHVNDVQVNANGVVTIKQSTIIDGNLTIGQGSTIKWDNGASTKTVNGYMISNAISGSHAIFTIPSGTNKANLSSPNHAVNLDYVDVDHNSASGITPFNSNGGIDNGNNINWTFNASPRQTQTGKARIQATTTRTQTGKANIIDPTTIPEVVAFGDTTYTTTKVQLNFPDTNFDEAGIVYATHHNPTIADSHIVAAKMAGPQFLDVSGLISCQTYYFRTYILRGAVYIYGIEMSLVMPCISSILFGTATDNLIGPYEIEILNASNAIVANLTGIAMGLTFSLIRNRPEEISLNVPLLALKQLASNLHVDVEDLLQTGIQTIRIKRKGLIICAGQLDYWEVILWNPHAQ
jgi:hypothetical protein